ncbi:MAG: tetratricopeptide repeat protein [Candidatus Ozemobacteraceae bacterium]
MKHDVKPPTDRLICPKCGLENEDGKFCGSCGGRLSAPVRATVSPRSSKSARSEDSSSESSENPTNVNSEAPEKRFASMKLSGDIPRPSDTSSHPSSKQENPYPKPARSTSITENPVSDQRTLTIVKNQEQIARGRPATENLLQNVRGSTTPEDPEASLDELAAAVKKHPSSPETYLALATAQLKKGKAERAYSTWRAMKTVAPDDVRVYRLGARILDTLGRREEAITALNRLLIAAPEDTESALFLARIQHESGRRREALTVLQSLRERASEHPDILLRLAENQLALGDPAAAQEDLSSYRKMAGENLDVFLMLGRAMLQQSFYDGAIRLYKEGLSMFSEDPDLLLGLGKALLGAGEKGQALLEFERAGHRAPDRIELLLEMGRLYGGMGMDEKANEMFDRLRTQKVRDGEIFLEIARYYQSRKESEKALKELERARELSPHNAEIVKTFGEILESRKDLPRAIAEYETFLEGAPNAAWALNGIIRCATLNNEHARVAKAQKRFIALGQATPDLWCDYGETLIRLGKFKDSTAAFEEAARLDPTCVRAYQAPELIKLEKARAEGVKLVAQAKEAVAKRFLLTAADRLERALELVPRETSWMRLLAEVSLRTGAITRASDLLSKVRATASDDYWVALQLSRVYEFDEKAQLAIELLSAALREHPTEIDGHILLLRLKRSQIQGDRFERDMLAALVKNNQHELGRLAKTHPAPLLIEGYIHYLFGMGMKFQADALKRAEEVFETVLERFDSDDPHAHRGLALVSRVRGENRKASHHLQELVKGSADPIALHALARLNANFQLWGEAKRCYTSLRSLFPENGMYRRRLIEAIAAESEMGGKNELVELISSCQEVLRNEPQRVWSLYDLGWAQTLTTRRSTQREEWSRRTLLTWNKAGALDDAPPWLRWGLMEAQLEFLKGADRHRALQQNIRVCEKFAREQPDLAAAHHHLGVAYLGFEDLTQTDRAVKHLETALFLDSGSAETAFLLARAYRSLGRSARVDAMRQIMLLLEPELLLKM